MAYFVNDGWANKEDGAKVKVDGVEYTIGTDNVFATVADALNAIQAADAAAIDDLVDAYVATLADDAKPNFTDAEAEGYITKAAYYEANKDVVNAWNDTLDTPNPVVASEDVEILSKSTVLDADTLTADQLAYFAARAEAVTFDADGKGKLEITADFSECNFAFEDFKDVKVSGEKAKASDIFAENDKNTYFKNKAGELTGFKASTVAATGKITVDDKGSVDTIKGYKTVAISGDGTKVGSVIANEYKVAFDEANGFEVAFDEEGSFNSDALVTSIETKATGSVTVSEGAEVTDMIAGYKNVTVTKAKVAGASNVGAGFTYDKVWTEAVYDENNNVTTPAEWTGKYKVSSTDVNSYSKVVATNKINWEKKSGSAKVAASYKADGTAKLQDGAEAGDLTGFATVNVTDSAVTGDISLEKQSNLTFSTAIKGIKDADDMIQLTETSNKKAVRGGKVTLKNASVGYNETTEVDGEQVTKFTGTDIIGYNTVSLTNSNAGDIENATGRLAFSSKAVYEAKEADIKADKIEKFDGTNVSFETTEIADAVYYEHTKKEGATGSVKVVVDKKATAGVEVGDIKGYTTVTLTGNGDKKVTAKDITGAVNSTEKYINSVVEDREEGADGKLTGGVINGKRLYEEKSTAAGSAKLTDAKAGTIENYKTVTLKNAEITGASTGDNESSKDEISYKTAKDGAVTVTEKSSSSKSAAGSFTATDSKVVDGGISGYATVKLTNTDAGDITGVIKESESSSEKNVYANYLAFDNNNMTNKQTSNKESYKATSAAMGSVTIKLDKNATAPVKDETTGEYTYAYEYGNIENYANVNVSGFVGKEEGAVANVVKVGSITGANTTSENNTFSYVSNYDYTEGKYTGEVEGKIVMKETETVAGSVKLTDAEAGFVSDYKTVTLKNATIEGASIEENDSDNITANITTADNVVTFKATETGKDTATGSFTATDSNVYGDISGYATVKLTNTSAYSVTGSSSSTSKTEYDVKFGINDWAANEEKFAKDPDDTIVDMLWGYAPCVTEGTVTEKGTSKATGSLTAVLDKNFDAEAEYSLGNVSGFANVKISGYDKGDKYAEYSVSGIKGSQNVTSEGSVTWADGKKTESKYTADYKAVGSATLTDVDVNGDISGFKKVTLTGVDMIGSIKGGESTVTETYDASKVTEATEGTEGNDGWTTENKTFVAGDLTLNDSVVNGSVAGFAKVAVKSGYNYVGSYEGTDKVDDKKNLNAETIDIAKKAVLAANEIKLNADDKIAVNGELVIYGSDVATIAVIEDGEGGEGEDTTTVVKALTGGKLTGKGTVFADSTSANAIKTDYVEFGGSIVSLGATSKGFRGSVEEAADDTKDGASDWSNGWLGSAEVISGNSDFAGDFVDFVEVEAGKEFKINVSGDEEALKNLTIKAGEQTFAWSEEKGYAFDQFNDYKYSFAADAEAYVEISLKEETKGSLSYTIA